MEPNYASANYPDLQPDGVFVCSRGTTNWSGFFEAKSERNPIRSDQILDYIALASKLEVDSVISISNEFPRAAHEPHYSLPKGKLKKREVFHFAWPEIRNLVEDQLDEPSVSSIEREILEETLYFLKQKSSGVQTYDSMPQKWPDFVSSSNVGVGFGTKTPGITEIVRAWHQERRDLRSKLSRILSDRPELVHPLGKKVELAATIAHDRNLLADEYQLVATFKLKSGKTEITVCADLKAKSITSKIEKIPSVGKARATVTWAIKSLEKHSCLRDKLVFGWKGKNKQRWVTVEDFLKNPERIREDNTEAPKFLQMVRETHNVKRFKSRKSFIEDVEASVLGLCQDAKRIGWVE